MLETCRKKRVFERVELLGHVVMAVEFTVVENLRKYFLGQDVLDQHFSHVGRDDVRIDRLLQMLEEFYGSLTEYVIVMLGRLDHVAQRR